MSRVRKQAVGEQFDLFLPYIADLNFRDQREMMERPFFSLAKSKRVKPIRRVIAVEAVALALMSARPRRLLHLIAWMPGAASRI